jgi:predicted small integral membrane protein
MRSDETTDTGREPAVRSPVQDTGRVGFLPIKTNWFDRLFIGVVGHVGLNLLWMRFLEDAIPLAVGTILGIAWIVIVQRWG